MMAACSERTEGKYVVVSQGILIARFTDKDEAIAYVTKANESWEKYKQECLDNYKPYADNQCFLYEEVDGTEENIQRII